MGQSILCAALPSGIAWEVRSTGNDSNGGGFVTGASGTDYSQQDGAQFSGTNLAVDGTTNTKVSSAAHNFAATDVGNLIHITAGTGWTSGFYEIVSVASNEATLDRSPAAVGTTGGTWAEGGALATPGAVLSNGNAAQTNSSRIFLKYAATPYAITTSLVWSTGGSGLGIWLIGYNAARSDAFAPGYAHRPTIQIASGNAGITMLSGPAYNATAYNLILDCNNQAGSVGASLSTYSYVYNVLAKSCDSSGIIATNVMDSEVTGLTANAGFGIAVVTSAVRNSVHDSAGASGFGALQVYNSAIGTFFDGNLIYNLNASTGCATCDGIRPYINDVVAHNTIYAVSRDGIRGSNYNMQAIYDNLIVSAATAGIDYVPGSAGPKSPFIDGNCFYGNGTNVLDDTMAGVPYTYLYNVADGANNLNNTAAADFRLKAASGCAAAGQLPVPGVTAGVASFGAAGRILPQASSGGAQ